MYVDDEPANLMPFDYYATMGDVKVKIEKFTSPLLAVEAYEKSLSKQCCGKGFPLIITDIMMPVMDGYMLAQTVLEMAKAKQQERKMKHGLTVLALTSCVNDGVRKEAEKVGIAQVFLKPLAFQTYEIML